MKPHTFILRLAISFACLTSVFAGEILIPKHHLAVTLPKGWQRMADKDTNTLIRAESDAGKLRFILSRSDEPQEAYLVNRPAYQNGIKQSMVQVGFTNIVRSEVIKVAGSDAYLCEARHKNKPDSFMQVIWFHEGHSVSFIFVSLGKPFKSVPDAQAIIDSLKVTKPSARATGL